MARTASAKTSTTTSTAKGVPTVTAGTITFAIVDAEPTRVRQPKANPMLEGVGQAKLMMDTAPGKGLSFTVPANEVGDYINHLRRAGKEHGVSVSVNAPKDDAGNYTGLISFRAVPKITRQRKASK